MEDLNFQHRARKPAGGTRQTAIIGVVASGNLEVLVERVLYRRADWSSRGTPRVGGRDANADDVLIHGN